MMTEIEQLETAGLSQGQIVRKRFFRHRGAVVSMIVLGFILILVATSIGWGPIPGWWMWGYTEIPPVQNGGKPTLSVIPEFLGGDGIQLGDHPFGQTSIGEDNFAQTMRGAQQSLTVVVIVGLGAAVMGVVLGALAGYYRGWVDSVIMRLTDVVITIPILIAGAVAGRLVGGDNVVLLGLLLAVFVWTSLARLVRGEFLTLREREFVDAAKLAGASDRRIIFKHILPNTVGVIIVNVTLLMAVAILLETSLSFLGFGIRLPDVSLGSLISTNQTAFNTRPWLFWWPGLFIVVIALCVNFVGDGLRDAFDPRQKRIPSPRKMKRV
jgi:peptide/nickel transport system permease protein